MGKATGELMTVTELVKDSTEDMLPEAVLEKLETLRTCDENLMSVWIQYVRFAFNVFRETAHWSYQEV